MVHQLHGFRVDGNGLCQVSSLALAPLFEASVAAGARPLCDCIHRIAAVDEDCQGISFLSGQIALGLRRLLACAFQSWLHGHGGQSLSISNLQLFPLIGSEEASRGTHLGKKFLRFERHVEFC